MTVKLAKFFGSNSTATPPPLPPPNPISSSAHHLYYQYQSQQQSMLKQQTMLPKLPHYNHYYDDDDDNMSMYSTTASIMTTRDHPFNNSQRPLLPARKPTQLLHKKKLNANNTASASNNTAATIGNATHQPQTPQQRQQKSYISPYVQQQKRDSAKGLHGFNDFDILSQQYNHHLQSPHIGYPYGSPPSPTANSSDFIFDPMSTLAPTAPKLNQPQYANISNYDTTTTTPTNVYHKVINTIDYYGQASTAYSSSIAPQDYIGKSSRFEDDFCCRRNDAFAQKRFDAASHSSGSSSGCSGSSTGGGGGPFIFGMPPEQQSDLAQRMSSNGRRLTESADTVICSDEVCERDNYSATMTLSGKSTMQQSTSDTSTSSHEIGEGSGKKGAKFRLLHKSITKKRSKKDKQLDGDDTATQQPKKPQQPTIKCVLVGDGAVGKTNLILSYLENRFNPEHVPTASDIYNADVMVNDSPVHLTLCDTAGQDTLDPLRELCYPDSDVFLLCFSVVKPETFHAIKTKWAPKFAKTKAALVLVGTQADLRTSSPVLKKLQTNGEKPISYADAWDLATTIGAKYIETSSAVQDKVKDVFDTAIWDGLLPSALPPTPPLWKKLLCLA